MPLEIQKSRATTQMAWRASAPIAATGTDVHAFFFCCMCLWLPAASPSRSNYSTCAPGKQFAAAMN